MSKEKNIVFFTPSEVNDKLPQIKKMINEVLKYKITHLTILHRFSFAKYCVFNDIILLLFLPKKKYTRDF